MYKVWVGKGLYKEDQCGIGYEITEVQRSCFGHIMDRDILFGVGGLERILKGAGILD